MKRFSLILLVAVISSMAIAKEKTPLVIHWKLNHHPEKFFTAAAAKFDESVQKLTNGQVRVKAVMAVEDNWGTEKEIRNSKWQVRNGEIEMTQIYTAKLNEFEPRLNVFDMPFMFESHAHFDAVVEGPLVNKLTERLAQYDYQPLAFTYSGGFLAIVAKKPLRRLEDFKGIDFRVGENMVNLDVFRLLGVNIVNTGPFEKAVPKDVYPISKYLEKGWVSGGDAETVDLQFLPTKGLYFNTLQHRMLTTVLVMNKNFWNKIPKKYQPAVLTAAREAAREERQLIAQEETRVLDEIRKQGGQVITPNEKEMARIREALTPVYDRFSPLIGPEIISEIKQLAPKAKIAKQDL